MAGTTFKKINVNRRRKVYPYIRKVPRLKYESDKETTIEIGNVVFTDADSVTYTFEETFISAPTITAVSVDSVSSGQADVNIFVSSVSTTSITLNASQIFTGEVHFHAMYIGS
jgi:hypothetical protein